MNIKDVNESFQVINDQLVFIIPEVKWALSAEKLRPLQEV